MSALFYILPYVLTFLLPFAVLLGCYEGARGIVAARRGENHLRVAADFIAAAVMFGVVALILYIGYGHHFPWFWLFQWIGDKL